MTHIDRVVSIDAETNGLHGQAFAVAIAVSDAQGEFEAHVLRCPVDGPVDPWVAEHVLPAIEDVAETHTTYLDMVEYVAEVLGDRPRDEHVIAHIAWPVEARLLLDAYPGEFVRRGPYPLIDVSSVLLAHGHNPLSVDEYLDTHGIPRPDGAPHNPLYDARAAERAFRHLMTRPTTEGKQQ